MLGAGGVVVTVALVGVIVVVRDVLVLIGLAGFLAVGLEPAVSWLTERRLSRPIAVAAVTTLALGLVAGFFALAIPVLVTQGAQFFAQLPGYLQALRNHNTFLGQLNDRFHLQQSIGQLFADPGGSLPGLAGGVLGAGVAVFTAATSLLIVAVLTIYIIADLPRIRANAYRLLPASRRPRAVQISDEIIAKVGTYVLGAVLVALIAGAATVIWLLIFGVPYALLLGLFVALLDLLPVLGSTVGGIVVSLVALTVSLPVALATAAFYLAYRFLEDYVLVPRIIGKVLEVPALATILAVLLGVALLGVLGAVIAIPAAAAIQLLIRELAFPRLDHT
jgi:predicted PurR-regulated permease PerM